MGFTEQEKIKLMSDVEVIKSKIEGLQCHKRADEISELFEKVHGVDNKVERGKYIVLMSILSLLISVGVLAAAIYPTKTKEEPQIRSRYHEVDKSSSSSNRTSI